MALRLSRQKQAIGGPSLLEFVTSEFAEQAEAAYEALGVTKLTMENVWHVFSDLLPMVNTSGFYFLYPIPSACQIC